MGEMPQGSLNLQLENHREREYSANCSDEDSRDDEIVQPSPLPMKKAKAKRPDEGNTISGALHEAFFLGKL